MVYLIHTISEGVAFNSGPNRGLFRNPERPKGAPRLISRKLPWTASSPCTYDVLSESEVNCPGVTRVKEDSSFVLFVCLFPTEKMQSHRVPLEKLSDSSHKHKFARLDEALYIADQKSHEAVEIRAPVEAKITQR